MSLIEASLMFITKKQYLFKLKSHIGLFNRLAVAQLLIALLTSGRAGMMGTGDGTVNYEFIMYSSDAVIIFTMAGVFAISILISMKEYRNGDFAFVSNRLSSNLSNIGFLLTVALIGGVTATLYGFVFRLVMYFFGGGQSILGENFFIPPGNLFLSIGATTLYLMVFSAVGYFFGILTRYQKILVIFVPLFLIVFISLQAANFAEPNILAKIVLFFGVESSFPIFIIKILMTITVLFTGSILISNRMEVRK